MPSSDVFGAHYVLRQSTPGHTHRLSEVIAEAHVDEVTVRREIDALALDGQVKRLHVGEHVMVKKTDEFDHENAPDVETANAPGSESTGLTRGLSPANYERPGPKVLDPEDYERPRRTAGLVPAAEHGKLGCPKGYLGWHEAMGKALPKQILQRLHGDQADQP